MLSVPIEASILEGHKENIQPLPGGRSVDKLARNLVNLTKSQLKQRDIQQKEKESFEQQLQRFDELDDPLQVYLDYIHWTHEMFPQGSNASSGLLALLERCTSCFRDVVHYKNDPRYLRVWLEYTKYSDSPRDIFVYLAKKDIGSELALYYEEFARYLEMNQKMTDAKQLYELGIERNARPIVRLQRSYSQFLSRQGGSRPLTSTSTSNDSTIRSALSVKRGNDVSPNLMEQNIGKKKAKLQVLNDDLNQSLEFLKSLLDDVSQPKELGTIKTRIKENTIQAKPWTGEVISQKVVNSRPTSAKIEVFKDSEEDHTVISSLNVDDDTKKYTTIKHPGKMQEVLKLNIELLYDQNTELSFVELLARKRQERHNEVRRDEQVASNHQEFEDDSTLTQRNTTFTIPLKDELPIPDSNGQSSAPEPSPPTMTLYSRMATNEVLSMFNDAGKTLHSDDEGEKTDGENSTNYDGFFTETIHPIVNSVSTNHPQDTMEPSSNSKKPKISTPPPPTPPADDHEGNDTANSSPFIERPLSSVIETDLKFVYPADEDVRNNLLDGLAVPMTSYRGFHNYRHTAVNRMARFREITNKKTKLITKGSRNSIIDFCGDEIYCLRCELGQGGYGIVYVVETEKGELKAMKVESPSSRWEFYILSQIHTRLDKLHDSPLSLFVKPEALFSFKDEGYLLMNYVRQGTILDVVNFFREEGTAVEETLCIFIVIDLLKMLESLHGIGIIHGDLKADNCMINFDVSHNTGNYNRAGQNGWGKNSVILIDFGRAIDMTLFSDDVQFIANWETDQQDCPQMNRHEPWTYEADYYGLACIIHTMLFGKYIEIKESPQGKICLSSSLKRYWQLQLWEPLFDLLLNPYPHYDGSYTKKPLVGELGNCRIQLQNWLEEKSCKRNMKAIITEVEQELNKANKKLLNSLR